MKLPEHTKEDIALTLSAQEMVETVEMGLNLLGKYLGVEHSVADGKSDGVDVHVRRVYTGNVKLDDLFTRTYNDVLPVEAFSAVTSDLEGISNGFDNAVDDVQEQVDQAMAQYATQKTQVANYATQAQEAIENGNLAGFNAAKENLRQILLEEEDLRFGLADLGNELASQLKTIAKSQERIFPWHEIAKYGRQVKSTGRALNRAISNYEDATVRMGPHTDKMDFAQSTGGIGVEAPYTKN